MKSPPLDRYPGWSYRKDNPEDRAFGQDSWVQKSYKKLQGGDDVPGFVLGLENAEQYKPPLIALSAIENVAKEIEADKVGNPSFSILQGSNALHNLNFPVFNGAVVIMASQGNILESPTESHIVRLWEYARDRTQGPAVALSTVDASMARYAFREHCDVMGMWLEKYDPEGENFEYQNGYLFPKQGKFEKCLSLLEERGLDLLMNVQQARVDNAGEKDQQWITQLPLFAFALNVVDYGISDAERKAIPGLCQKLLELQYQAAARVAVLKSRALGRRIPLVLTPVGGGAFMNPPEAIRAAIESIGPIVANADVDVVLSVFDKRQVPDFQKISFLKDCPVITHEEMRAKKTGKVITAQSTSFLGLSFSSSFFKNNPKLVATALVPIPASILLTYGVSSLSDYFFNTTSADAVNHFFSAKMQDASSLDEVFKTPGFIYGLAALATAAVCVAMYKQAHSKQKVDSSLEEKGGVVARVAQNS